MPAVLAAFFVACILPVTLAQGRPGGRASFDIVRIDGAKNPEMIPEWSAWEFALSVLAKGPGEIPAELIPHYSEQESAILLKAAAAQRQREADYHARVKRELFPLNGKEPKERIEALSREMALEYRWQLLHARDALLEALNPAAQAALRAWVESTKKGTTISILRKDLPFFRQPQ